MIKDVPKRFSIKKEVSLMFTKKKGKRSEGVLLDDRNIRNISSSDTGYHQVLLAQSDTIERSVVGHSKESIQKIMLFPLRRSSVK